MSYHSSVTPPEVEAMIIERMRRASALDKWRMVAELNASVRAFARRILYLMTIFPNDRRIHHAKIP